MVAAFTPGVHPGKTREGCVGPRLPPPCEGGGQGRVGSSPSQNEQVRQRGGASVEGAKAGSGGLGQSSTVVTSLDSDPSSAPAQTLSDGKGFCLSMLREQGEGEGDGRASREPQARNPTDRADTAPPAQSLSHPEGALHHLVTWPRGQWKVKCVRPIVPDVCLGQVPSLTQAHACPQEQTPAPSADP